MNNKKCQWLIDLGNNDEFWADPDNAVFPIYVVNQYNSLREFARNGNLYGLMLQIKDLFETLLKIPCVVALSILTENEAVEEDNDNLMKIYSFFLEKTMAMGDWNAFAALLRKNEIIKKNNVICQLIDRTRTLYDKKIGNGKETVVQWRNEAIGHGLIRSEDDEDNARECSQLIEILRDYFLDRNVYDCYRQIYFTINGQRIVSIDNEPGQDAEIELYAGGSEAVSSNFVHFELARLYFFDSFYSRKKWAKYIEYDKGNVPKDDEEIQEYFKRLQAEYQNNRLNMKDAMRSKKQNSQRDKAMQCLADDEDYIKPEYLLSRLRRIFEEEPKSGVILIKMERGMGKTAFTLHADSDYPGGSLLKNAAVRVYNLADAHLRGVNDFLRRTELYLWRAPDIYNGDYHTEYEARFSGTDNRADMARMLNEFGKLCIGEYVIGTETEYAVYILDGVDELTEDSEEILSCIPVKGTLAEGTYLILTSRFEDEEGLSTKSREMIRICEAAADHVIEIRRTDEDYRKCLQKFVKKLLPDLTDTECASYIEKSENRFLRCKLLRSIDRKEIVDSDTWTGNVFEKYMGRILAARNAFARKDLLDFLSAVTLMNRISLDEYTRYFQASEVTFRLVGCINDALPMMTIERRADGNYYRWGSEEYREIFLNVYKDEMKAFVDGAWSSFKHWYECGAAELEGALMNAEYPHGIPIDQLEYFGNIDDCMYYMVMFNNILKTADEMNVPGYFYTEERFGLFCRSASTLYNKHLCVGSAESDRVSSRFRENIYEVLYRISEDREKRSWILDNIDSIVNLGQSLSYDGRFDERITNVALSGLIEDKDKRWIELILSDCGGDNEEYLQEIKNAGAEDLLKDYIVSRSLKAVVFHNYSSWESEELSVCNLIEDILNAQIGSETEELLLSLRVYLSLIKAIRNSEKEYKNTYLEKARKYYKELTDRGYEFKYIDADKCTYSDIKDNEENGFTWELTQETVDEMLADDFLFRKEITEINESLSQMRCMDQSDTVEMDKCFRVLWNADKDVLNDSFEISEIDRLLKLYYGCLVSALKDHTSNISELYGITVISRLIDRVFEEKDRAAARKEIIDILLNREDWSEDNDVVCSLRILFSDLIWNQDDDKTLRREYFEKYIFKVDPVYYSWRLFNRPEIIHIHADQPTFSPDGLWYLMNYRRIKPDASDDEIKQIASSMNDSFYHLLNRAVESQSTIEYDQVLRGRAELNAVCRQLFGCDINDGFLRYIEDTCKKITDTVERYDVTTDIRSLFITLRETARILYMTGEYSKAVNFFTKLSDLIADLSDSTDDTFYLEGLSKEINAYNAVFKYLLGSDRESVMNIDFEYFTYDQDGDSIYFYEMFFILGDAIRTSVIDKTDREFDYAGFIMKKYSRQNGFTVLKSDEAYPPAIDNSLF